MGLLRLLFLLLLAWLIWWMVQPLLQHRTKQAKKKAAPKVVEDMVRCHYCGLNVPRQEALHDGRFYFCSEEHMHRSEDD